MRQTLVLFWDHLHDKHCTKMKFSIKDFLSKCDQIYRKLFVQWRMKLVSISCFLIFIKGLLIDLETSYLKKKAAEVASVQKICLIKLFFGVFWAKCSNSSEFNCGFQYEIQITRTLFFHMVLRKFIENTNNKPIFRQCNIFNLFKILIFFRSVLWSLFLFWSPSKKSVKSETIKSVLYLTLFSLFCCALTTGRCHAFQYFFVNQQKLEFYDPLFLVTMVKQSLSKNTLYALSGFSQS